MVFIPRVAVKNSNIAKTVGTTPIGNLLTGFPSYFGQGYGAAEMGIDIDMSGLVSMLSSILSITAISEFSFGPGTSQNVGGYNSDNFLFMLDPVGYVPGDQTTQWQVGFWPQTASDGIDPAHGAPTISVVTGPDTSTMQLATGVQGVTDKIGLSGASLMVDFTAGETYLCETDFATIDFFNAFQLEAGEVSMPFEPRSMARWLFDGANFWLIYVTDLTGELVLVEFQPQVFGGGFSATKYSITFDDSDFNAALIAGHFELDGLSDTGFVITFNNQPTYAGIRPIFLHKNGLLYDEFILTGDANTEANIANGFGITVDNSGQFYLIGFDLVGGTAALFFPFVAGAPLKTRNPQPVPLPCASYCIPFLKQRSR